MRLKIFICLLLAGITLALYWPARHFDFVYDDDLFFLTSPGVTAGLGWHGLEWVMTSVVVSNWHPVTVLSFVLTHQFFGMNPGAEHLVNVAFHAASAALLFLVLLKLTEPTSEKQAGSQSLVTSAPTWRCAIVAAIFAWHPLRVESVAWIAERKDVLFVFFMLLSLLCYAEYVKGFRNAKASATTGLRLWNWPYLLSLLFFVLSFMSKAMVVTLPFLLLLLDFWPLGRFTTGESRKEKAESRNRIAESGHLLTRRLLIEKIPFFALMLVFCALTFWIQKEHKAVASVNELGIVPRFENATLSYVYYLGHFFWPMNLAINYPYPNSFDAVQVLLAGLLLLAISALCLLQIRQRPYLAVGWFWYLGMMVPVIGLVQVGIDSMADRYTYIPLIGPVISLVWLASEWARTQFSRNFLAAGAIVILAACVITTRWQLQFWQNSVALFNRAIAVAPQNLFPHVPLALGLEEQKHWREAAVQFEVSLIKTPSQSLIKLTPSDVYKSIADLHLGNVLAQMGYERRADEYYETFLKKNPDDVLILNNLAWSLATYQDASVRNGKRAVELGERACQLTHYKKTVFMGTLAAAYAEAGRFDDAIAMAQKAIANAQQKGETDLAETNEKLLQLYQAHKTYIQP